MWMKVHITGNERKGMGEAAGIHNNVRYDQ